MTGTSPLDGFDLSSGCFYSPTVVTDIETDDELWKEEVFGPVVVVKRFEVTTSSLASSFTKLIGHCHINETESDGIHLANDCQYGLGAGIWTNDLSRAHRVSTEIDAGLVWVNTHHRNDPSSPW